MHDLDHDLDISVKMAGCFIGVMHALDHDLELDLDISH